SFVVPGTATLGTTGMRITVAEGESGASLTSCLSYGYGETEDYLVTIAGPLASNPPSVSHTAITSANGSAQTINADISDIDGDLSSGAGAPTLWYRVGTSGSFTSVTMTAASSNSPGTKGSNKLAAAYSGVIPGQSVSGTIVQYYIAAQDDENNVTTSPSGGSGTNPPGTTDPGSFNSYTILLNDNCADALPINWTASVTGSTTGATQDTGNDQTCAGETSTNKSVWYTFTVPAGETWEVQFNTEGATTYDTAMELFSGTCGSLTSVECDDDGGVSPSAGSWIPSTTDGPPPSNPFGPKRSLTSGTYFLMMSGYGTSSGSYQLNAYKTYVVDPVTNGGSPIPDGTVNIGSGDGTSFVDLALSGGGSNPTSIIVEATAGTTPGSFDNGVARTWSLNIVGGTGTASLTLYFLATEMTPGMVIGGLAEVWVRISGIWTSVGTGLIVDEGGGFVSVTVTLALAAPETNKYVNDLNDINGDVGIGEVGDTPLYVNLASFEAKQENKDIVLRWTTASEVDNKGFIVYGGKKVIDAKDGTERIAYIELGNYKNTASLVGKSSSTLETKYSFIDLREHNIGEDYYYYVADEDKDGTVTQHTEFTSKVTYKNTAETQTQFASYELKQNHPNPFNPETTIEFTISKTQNVEVSVYNVNGQLVKTLVNQTLEGNAVGTNHKLIWDGTDASGNIVSSGIYFYQIKTGNFVQTKKATFLK
ncbi:T9SS type A sorting domain-containing protein, partial [bacterium]|nr:T9SS type A sorting domain-containing protein [bacterium]